MLIKPLVAGVALATVFGTAIASDDLSSFAALKGVNSKEMTAEEMSEVKGQHIHFAIITPKGTGPLGSLIPRASEKAGPHNGFIFEVNFKEVNLYGPDQSNPGSGPGYSGLCGAALKSPSLWIPGQNPVTGIGGGC